MKILNTKKVTPDERSALDLSIEYLHEKKILNKIKIIMARDLVNSMDIVSSHNRLIKANYDSSGLVYITSKVDGEEGTYDIFHLSIELVEHDATYIPKLIIQNLYVNDTIHSYLLTELEIIDVLGNIRGGFYSRSNESYVLNRTQSERLDILDKVSETMDKLQREYRFRGYSLPQRRRELL